MLFRSVATSASNVIAFGTTAYDGAAANTAKGVPDLTNVFALSTGDRVAIKVFGGATHQFHTTVGTKHHALLTTDGVLDNLFDEQIRAILEDVRAEGGDVCSDIAAVIAERAREAAA